LFSSQPWHRGGAYRQLCNSEDEEHLPWVLAFNHHDLYSKAHQAQDVQALKPYYQGLIKKYFPHTLNW